jgi:hypothetical protein
VETTIIKPLISSMHKLNLKRKILDEIVCEVDGNAISTTASSIALQKPLPLIRHFFLIPNIINELTISNIIFHVLLESVLTEFDHHLPISTFFT